MLGFWEKRSVRVNGYIHIYLETTFCIYMLFHAFEVSTRSVGVVDSEEGMTLPQYW